MRCSDDACPSGFSCRGDGFCYAEGSTQNCTTAPDAFDEACVGVVCDELNPPVCLPGDVLRTFALPGTCNDGTCSYPSVDQTCVGTCAAATCSGGWIALQQQNVPTARFGHTAVWTGTEMIVWGGAVSSTGSLSDGARFDPVTGNWVALPASGAPSARRDHSAVWTGTEMIVWGGSSITQGTGLADGGRFDPVANTWSALPSAGAPRGRFGHTAVWTGTEMIVWGGGVASTSSLADGARFDPGSGAWTVISDVGAPSPRRDHSAVWTGTDLIVWGGSSIHVGGGVFGDAASYDPIADAWSPSVTSGVPPSDRFQHAAVWTGSEMLLWGGAFTSTATLGDGARMALSNAWGELPTTDQPSPRRRHTAVWTGTEMLVWGGSTIVDGGSVLSSGARFALFTP